MAEMEFDWERNLAAVRQGDEEAAHALVEQLYPTVIRIVRRHLPARQSEEDLAQEIFLRLFSRLDRYRPRAGIPFVHWVSRVALTTCLDILRAERRRPEIRWTDLSAEDTSWIDFLVAEADIPSPTATGSTRAFVQRLLSELPPADRLILNLLEMEERSVRDVSALTGWSVANVKVRAFRARRRLRRLVIQLKKRAPYEGI